MQRITTEDEPLLTNRRNYELGQSHVARSFIRDPLAIEANGVAIRAGLAIREATGLAKAVREWKRRQGHDSLRSRPKDINQSQFLILRDLYFAFENSLFMTEISNGIDVTMTYVTKLIDDLIANGWVVRIEDSLDKRKTLAKLTPEGMATIEELLPPVSRQIEKNWSVLSDEEKRILVHLLSKILTAVNHSEDAIPRPDMEEGP